MYAIGTILKAEAVLGWACARRPAQQPSLLWVSGKAPSGFSVRVRWADLRPELVRG